MRRKTILISLFVGVAAAGAVLMTGPNKADPQRATVAELQSHCNAQPAGNLTPPEPDIVKCREVGREIALYMANGDIICDLDTDDIYRAIRATLITAPDNRLDEEAALFIIEQWLDEGTRCRKA